MDRSGSVARLVEALVDPECEDIVEMVLHSPALDTYTATAVDGSVTFTRERSGRSWRYREVSTSGRNPLASAQTDRFLGHRSERSSVFPTRLENSYPFAFDSVAQFFDAPTAPDLLATHTARHLVDGYLGQHGSLGTVQARAPFLASGAGVRSLGTIPEATRVVNVAPTVAALLGIAPHPEGIGPNGERDPEALLRRQDGEVERAILEGTTADHVVVFLLDGCNANLLADVMAAAEAPHMAGLLDAGTMFGHGSMASLPTATLANHTTAITGAHPGHSGVLHNAWVTRAADGSVSGEVDLLDLEQIWWSSSHVSGEVETLFEAVERTWPGAFTCATFEFCDRGAGFSTFALVRDGTASDLPAEEEVRHLGGDNPSDRYRFMSRVDHLSLTHTLACWSGEVRDEPPKLSWCSLALTDEAGHESGPHGAAARAAVRDSDARVGEVIEAVERAGVLDSTAFVVIADHGMEQADPGLDRTWDPVLASTGVVHSDVGGGLIYLH